LSDSRLEKPFIVAAFVIYLIFQFHAIAYRGYWGQDWIAHKTWIAQAAENPWKFFQHYTQGQTNPPIYDLLGAGVRGLVGLPHYLAGIGVMNVLFGFAGLCAAYAVARRLIESSLLRVAGMVLVLFLPFAMIHAQVIANDALSTPLFWVLLWLVVRFRPDSSRLEFSACVGLLSVLLVGSILVRFTFASFILATGVWAISLWWTRLLSVRRLAVMLLLVTGVPGIFTYLENVQFTSEAGNSFDIHPSIPLSQAEMNPRSILWLRPADVDVLEAPAYNWFKDGDYELLRSNKHSFPALLHLGMFTDVLNIYQFDPYDSYFGFRTLRHHHRMRSAVRTGILFSLLAVIGVIVLLIRSTASVVARRKPQHLALFAVLLFCTAWFANLVVLYPFIPGAYYNGWWTSRLHAPALIGFFIVGFVFLDQLKWQSRRLHAVVLAAVVSQSGLHASFLWPSASDERLYEATADMSAASWNDAMLRVVSWQAAWETDLKPAYWLDRAIGIIVNRPANPPNLENWLVSFTVKPGPSARALGGVLRVSFPNAEPQTFEFDGPTDIEFETPLAAGRNDIRVELVEPEPREIAGDVLIRMLEVSNIKIRRGTNLKVSKTAVIAGTDFYVLKIDNLSKSKVDLRYSLDGIPQPEFPIFIDEQGEIRIDVPLTTKKGSYHIRAYKPELDNVWHYADATVVVK
jgi:hypothetical protein